MEPGTYTILLELEEGTMVTFGAAGSRRLEAGAYAYTGSAFGPGGLSRVDRHQRVLQGRNDARHWHVDYLLGLSNVVWLGAWISPNREVECKIATSLPGRPVEGVGASDCHCNSHLTYGSRETLLDAIESLHKERYS